MWHHEYIRRFAHFLTLSSHELFLLFFLSLLRTYMTIHDYIHIYIYTYYIHQVFCSAHSTVTIHDSTCQQLVASGQVGLGQLFRYLDRLPTFELMDAGYHNSNDNVDDDTNNNINGGGLWRVYELSCKEVSCRIREDFHPQAWEMVPPSLLSTTTTEESMDKEDTKL
jgi:hypothetical protein